MQWENTMVVWSWFVLLARVSSWVQTREKSKDGN